MSIDTAIQTSLMDGENSLPPTGMLRVGDPFPKFSLTAVVSAKREDAFKVISSEDYTGKWLVIFAWPKDFTVVCPTEIVEFSRLCGDFQDRDAQVLGFSIDSSDVHLAWRQSREDFKTLQFPILSDIRRELSWRCGILDTQAGIKKHPTFASQRATFIVDPEGMIQFSMMNPMKVGRSPIEVLRVLDGLQTDGLCPCGWQAGDDNI
jgi:lipoyl-dependent peroxiredoxin subunit C